MKPAIDGSAVERLHGHLAGSRSYGTHTRSSDWDYSFEDNAAIRAFLTSSGFKQILTFEPGTRGNSTSYWKHRYYNCEVFLTRDNEIKQVASALVRWLQCFEVLHDKQHRVAIWSAIELCLTTVWGLNKEYKAAKQKKDADGFSMRDKPLR